MKLFAVFSSLSLSVAFAVLCTVSPVCGQAVIEAPPQASPAVETAELSEFPDELRTRAPKTLAEVKLLEQRVQELVEKVRPATISMFGGTGVVVGKEGYILSAGHVVIQPGRKIRIRFPDGTRATAITLGVDDRYDSGMAKITSKGDFPYLEMGKSADLELGEWCLAVGFPVSFSRSDNPPVRLGRILSNRSRTIVSDCTIMGGDSGGPLFDLDGNVIGINSRVSGSLNQNVHVPVDVFTRDWESLTKEEVRDRSGKLKPDPSKRGFLGISWSRGGTTTTIGRVIRGSAAETAGLKSGDLILEIAGTRTREISDATKRLSSFSVGDEVSVKVRRDEKEIRFKVTLGKRS
ncbi:S1C family serine protease [Mariniblastus sp.]|nr:S1C family serine protease [Mariniblastus sp.]